GATAGDGTAAGDGLAAGEATAGEAAGLAAGVAVAACWPPGEQAASNRATAAISGIKAPERWQRGVIVSIVPDDLLSLMYARARCPARPLQEPRQRHRVTPLRPLT